MVTQCLKLKNLRLVVNSYGGVALKIDLIFHEKNRWQSNHASNLTDKLFQLQSSSCALYIQVGETSYPCFKVQSTFELKITSLLWLGYHVKKQI
ncbi:hypothetical protein P8452_55710 [Trifolium repens]|nr:hypothetical protein P8452_55710 [Trifolium repens]